MARMWVLEDKVPEVITNRDARSLAGYKEKVALLDTKHNHLTIDNIEIVVETKEGQRYSNLRYKAHCLCDCGNPNFVIADVYNVLRGNTKSCGCINNQSKRKFTPEQKVFVSRLRTLSDRCLKEGMVLEKRWDYKIHGTAVALTNLFKDMGQPQSQQHVLGRKDTSGPWNKKNCEWTTREAVGGKRRGVGWKNGNWTADNDGYNREYQRVWAMNDRCYNPKNHAYPRYGGRGITVCNRWRIDLHGPLVAVANFIADMGNPPTRLHSLDRKDNDKGYSKANCKWATEQEQANNRGSNIIYSYGGKELTRTQLARTLAKEYNYDMNAIRAKLASTGHSAGWIKRWIERRIEMSRNMVY